MEDAVGCCVVMDDMMPNSTNTSMTMTDSNHTRTSSFGSTASTTSPSKRKRQQRRTTVNTCPCSDDEDVSFVALVPTEDTDDAMSSAGYNSDTRIEGREVYHHDDNNNDDDDGCSSTCSFAMEGTTSPCHNNNYTREEEDEEDEDEAFYESLDLSLHSLRQKTSNRHLRDLLEENQRVLELLLHSSHHQERNRDNSKSDVNDSVDSAAPIIIHRLPTHPTPQCGEAAQTQEQQQQQLHVSATIGWSRWRDALSFELYHSLPGAAALLLFCTVHVSTYEFISNLAYEAVESTPATAPATSNIPDTPLVDSDATALMNLTRLYTIMLLVGCLIARYTGLVWNFLGPRAYHRVKFVYHNRLRWGAKDALWLHRLHQCVADSGSGEVLLGCLHMVAYYLCYIAVFFFLSRLAVTCDQRESILAKMPSNVYQQSLQQQQQVAMLQLLNNSTSNVNSSRAMHPSVDQESDSDDDEYDPDTLYMCPTRDYSPDALFGGSMVTTSHSLFAVDHPLSCVEQLHHYDEDALWPFGPEDDAYFYQRLAKNSYEKFFGQDYEAAFFDSTHQVLFYAGVAAAAIITLKSCLGFSYWAGW